MEISKITLFLSKELRSFEDVINQENFKKLKTIIRKREFKVNSLECRLYYMEKDIPYTQNPAWLEFINEKLSVGEKIKAVQKSMRPSGVLFIKDKNRLFAAAFGTSGKSLVRIKSFEKDFGIKVAMNSCDVEKITQTKSSIRSYQTQLIYRMNSIPGDASEFGLTEMEFLDFLSANLDNSEGVSIHGKDSLTIKTDADNKLNWDKFIGHLKAFRKYYKSQDYKDRFPNYALLEPVDAEKEEELDGELSEMLKSDLIESLPVHLSIPEMLDDEKYSFIYGNPNNKTLKPVAFVEIKHILPHSKKTRLFTKKEDISTDKLRAYKVYAYDDDINCVAHNKSWTIYDCIVAEIKLNNECYVLFAGQWRVVDSDFYKDLNEFIDKNIKVVKQPKEFCNIDIICPNERKAFERIFNEKVSEKSDVCYKFDASKLRIGNGTKNNEFCDLFFDRGNYGEIVHVKRKNSSSSMNHLFSQGRYYGEAFLKDEVFLKEIRNEILSSNHKNKNKLIQHFPEKIENVTGGKYTVSLWILYSTSSAPKLSEFPLMAKYELKHCYEVLRKGLSYKDLSLSLIPVIDSNKLKEVSANKS